MTKFNYKKWVTEIKYGKQPHLFEQDDKDDKKDDKKVDKKDKPSKPKKDGKPSKPKKDDKPSKPKKDDKPSKSDDGGGGKTSDTLEAPGAKVISNDILFPAGMKRESSSDLMEQINPDLRKVTFRFVTTLCTSQYGNISLGDQDNCVLCHGHLNSNFGCPSFHVDGIPCCNGVGGGSSTYVGTNTAMITVDGNVPQVGQLFIWDDTALMGSIVEITAVLPPYTANNNPHNYSSTSCPNQVYNCSGTSTSSSCFPIVATKCAGTSGQPIGTQGSFPCAMIDGQPATQALVGQQIKHDGTMVQGSTSVWTVDSVDLNTDNGPTYQGMNAFPNASLTTQGAQCASTGSAGCDNSDFDVTASCADTNLINGPQGNIGGANSWTTWLTAQMNAFNGNAGCNQFGAIQNWTLAQIAPTANCPALPGSWQGQYGGENAQGVCHSLISVKRKFAKAKWGYCMSQLCAGGSQAGC